MEDEVERGRDGGIFLDGMQDGWKGPVRGGGEAKG